LFELNKCLSYLVGPISRVEWSEYKNEFNLTTILDNFFEGDSLM